MEFTIDVVKRSDNIVSGRLDRVAAIDEATLPACVVTLSLSTNTPTIGKFTLATAAARAATDVRKVPVTTCNDHGEDPWHLEPPGMLLVYHGGHRGVVGGLKTLPAVLLRRVTWKILRRMVPLEARADFRLVPRQLPPWGLEPPGMLLVYHGG
eukprot:CAMPEP_0117480008 /NCGR_PEP_ID=MMETSP0784-20121206/12174_1 /TAXON_ID=39447 /ORGANISM="" /LENGTH=152 /DNA_ID=CAMNT_0005274443 /DNA_START=182 /DNA_END=636 /DNA_ORIENTATION=+